MSFSEAWLREHNARMAVIRDTPVAKPVPVGVVRFTLKEPTILLNVLLRTHWAQRAKYQRSLSAQMSAAVGILPANAPFDKARVTIIRRSIREADHDGCVGGMKLLVDCLLQRSKRHPDGIGLIVDDSPDHLDLVVKQERVGKRNLQGTEVVIEPLGRETTIFCSAKGAEL